MFFKRYVRGIALGCALMMLVPATVYGAEAGGVTDNSTAADGSADAATSADETADSEEESSSGYKTNAELIAAQDIVIPDNSGYAKEFRMMQVDAVPAFLQKGCSIYTEAEDGADIVGTAKSGALVYLLQSEDDTWIYAESGECRGFVRADQVLTGDDLQAFLDDNQASIRNQKLYQEVSVTYTTVSEGADETALEETDTEEEKTTWKEDLSSAKTVKKTTFMSTQIEEKRKSLLMQEAPKVTKKNSIVVELHENSELVEWQGMTVVLDAMDNPAETYFRYTAYDPVAEKVYAVCQEDATAVYEEVEAVTASGSNSAAVVGMLGEDDLAYILAEPEDGVYYIESGDVRGFVSADAFLTGAEADELVAKTGESQMTTAVATVDPDDNKALYYTITSPIAADEENFLRRDIVDYALKWVGNPYVWGGTSLTDGADCSGFVLSIYAEFGFDLIHYSAIQAEGGEQIPVSYALPGDLIFYAKDGLVHHVAMYIGDGKTVQAHSSKAGIIVTDTIGSEAVWAVRLIGE